MPGHGAAAVIFDAQGRVLLVKENYDRRRYSLPGGAIEDAEAPHDAATRETWEETGIEVAVDHLVGLYRLDNGFVAYVFRCSIVAGSPICPDSGEIAEVGWYAADALPSPVSNVLHYGVRDAVAGLRGVIRDSLPRVS